eukprot:Phypoly_transcript_19295.p1 GENE.Phypoly_transcript_19295~~Phypoly_transcript_19295.p1  ORF type:complete len:196 (+),score=34.71 Phypoly_transcript_19295:25-588(+)
MGSCGINGFTGIYVTSVSGTPSITISGNTLQNFNCPCIHFTFYAIYVEKATSEINNNFINNITLANGELAIIEYTIVSLYESGSIKNLTISNIVLNDQTKEGSGLTGIGFLQNNKVLTIDGLVMTNFLVEDTVSCAAQDTNCASAPGEYLVGISSSATVTAKSIFLGEKKKNKKEKRKRKKRKKEEK